MSDQRKAVIWDLDGTLVDTSRLHFAAWAKIANDRGQPFSQDDFARTFGRRNPEILSLLFGPNLDSKTVDDLGDIKEERFRAAAISVGVPMLPGAWKTVTALSKACWRQAIGSSAPRANIELLTELTGLARYLAAIVAMEDTRRGKPDPEVFLKAAGKLAVSPANCVVVEDAVFGVQAAKAAGMSCIAVRGGGHSRFSDLQAAGADHVVESLEEIDLPLFDRLAK